jgi:trk system potassium uptake protein TrkH
MCGTNFALYYQFLKGNIKGIFKNEEFRLYVAIVTGAIVLITLNLYGNIYGSVKESIRYAAFQVASIITTTGYATTDFNTWPSFSKLILLLLMFVGGCAGSTGGGIKSIRILLLFKAAKMNLMKMIHPKAVYSVRVGGRTVDEKTIADVLGFFFIYIIILCVAVLIVALEGKDLVTTVTSVITTISNIGPGLEIVGPMGNFSSFTDLSKMVLSFCMIIGRLEIYPILLLLMPKFWVK